MPASQMPASQMPACTAPARATATCEPATCEPTTSDTATGRCHRPSGSGDRLHPLPDVPVPDDALQHEWIARGELLGCGPGREDAHGAGPIAKRPDQQEAAALTELVPAGLMRREVHRRLLRHVIRRL